MNQMRPPQESNDLLHRFEQLLGIGVALSKERDINKLLETILVAAKDITNADGGTLYRMTEERTLKFEIMRNDTLGISMGGTSGVEIPFYPLHLFDKKTSYRCQTPGHRRSRGIFEALTAKDRPYKKGKTLADSLTILGKFKLGGHVDPDLFDVFMWEKVYEKYARQFLDPEQIDIVDLSKIPGYVPPPRSLSDPGPTNS